jgi:hypothetical protein
MPRTKHALVGLRWVLGLVVLLESVHFALTPVSQFAKSGLPLWLPLPLGGSEALAALLFLAPATRLAGGCALLGIFAIAMAIHFLHRQFDVGSLLVYAVAVVVCMEAPHDR